MRRRALTWLLLLALLLPQLAWAEAPAQDRPSASQETAFALLEQVFATQDVKEQMRLIEQAAAAAPEDVEILVDCAQMMFYLDQTGEYLQRSEQLLRDAYALATGDEKIAVLQMLAEQMLLTDRIDEAVTLVEQATQENPHNETLTTTMATVLYFAGQREEAIGLLDALLEDSPMSLEARRLRATILLDEARWEEALHAYQQIEADWPEYLDGVYGQFLTYIASGDFDKGLRALDLLLGAGADDDMWVERSRILLWKQYRPEEALADTDPLLRMNPAWIDALIVRTVSLIMLERYDEAMETADETVKSDAAFGGLLRSIVMMNEGNWAQAEQELTGLTENEAMAYTFYKNLATVRLDGYNDAQGALDYMAQSFAAAGGEGDMDMYLQLGQAYRRMGKRQEAARAFELANQLTFEDASPLYYLTMVSLEAGKGDLARETMAELEKRYPGWYETMMARVIVDDVFGDAEAASEAYQTLKAKFPFPAASLTNMEASLLATAGDEAGREMIEAVVAGEETTVADWDSYAFILIRLDDFDGAEKALDEANARLEAELAVATPTEAAGLQISLLSTEATLRMLQGKPEEAIALLKEAAALGWTPYELQLNPRFAALTGHEDYAALLALSPEDGEAWDLSIPPTIPQVQ